MQQPQHNNTNAEPIPSTSKSKIKFWQDICNQETMIKDLRRLGRGTQNSD